MHVVRALILVAVMEGLLLLAVSHHEAVLKLPKALLLEIQTVMNELFFMKYSRDSTVPVAVGNIG